MTKVKNTIKIISLILTIIICIFAINKVFIPHNNNTDKWTVFYKYDKNTIDIIHLGSSHSHRTFIPMIESEALNVDSFTLSMAGVRIDQIEYMIKEIVKYQKPKIIAIEMFSITNYKEDDTVNSHRAFDTMRFSLNKIKAIINIIPKEEWSEFFFPITTYHLRWKKSVDTYITDIFNKTDNVPYFGYDTYDELLSVTENDRSTYTDGKEEKVFEIDEGKMKNLDEIVRTCRENNIKLIFVISPFNEQSGISGKELSAMVERLQQYAIENDVDIVDYVKIDLDNFNNTDLHNSGHTNIDGAVKVTTHFTNYLKENYYYLLKDCSWDYKQESIDAFKLFNEEYEKFLLKKEQMINENK